MKYLAALVVLHFLFIFTAVSQAQWVQTKVPGNRHFTSLGFNRADFTANQINFHREKIEKQFAGKGYQWIQKNKILQKKNSLGSFIYKPILAICDDTIRGSYTYDANGNLLTYLTETWQLGNWINVGRITNTYDISGNMIITLSEIMDNGNWRGQDKTTYTYDNLGNMLTAIYQSYSLNDWVNTMKLIYDYNISGKIVSEIMQSYDIANGWVNNSQLLYTYDNLGELVQELQQNYSTSSWVNNNRYIYTYNNLGDKASILYEEFSLPNWVSKWRETYLYDGLNITSLNEVFLDPNWVSRWRQTRIFDNSGNMITYLYESYSNSSWVNSEKWEATYDNAGNILDWLGRTWSNTDWSKAFLQTHEYNIDGNCILARNFKAQDTSWVPGLSEVPLVMGYNNHKDNLNFPNTVASVTYNSFTDVASEKLNPNSFNLLQNYPNPFNPSTLISYSLPSGSNVKLTVFNSLGQTVKILENGYKSAGEHSLTFNASELPSGVYFYRLEAGKFTQVRKMMFMK